MFRIWLTCILISLLAACGSDDSDSDSDDTTDLQTISVGNVEAVSIETYDSTEDVTYSLNVSLDVITIDIDDVEFCDTEEQLAQSIEGSTTTHTFTDCENEDYGTINGSVEVTSTFSTSTSQLVYVLSFDEFTVATTGADGVTVENEWIVDGDLTLTVVGIDSSTLLGFTSTSLTSDLITFTENGETSTVEDLNLTYSFVIEGTITETVTFSATYTDADGDVYVYSAEDWTYVGEILTGTLVIEGDSSTVTLLVTDSSATVEYDEDSDGTIDYHTTITL